MEPLGGRLSCVCLLVIAACQLERLAADARIKASSKLTRDGNAELTCTVPNLGKRKIIWTRATSLVPLSVGTQRFTPDSRLRVTSLGPGTVKLTIRAVSRPDSGQYQCLASGVERLVQTVSLDIGSGSASTRLRDTVTEVKAKVGDSVLLPCHVDNIDMRKVMWVSPRHDVVSLRKKVLTGDPRHRVVHDQAVEWSLAIKSVRLHDFGVYTCVVNSRPVLTRRVTLTNTAPVSTAPVLRASSSLKAKTTADEGDSVTLHCDFLANPPAKVFWYLRTKSKGKGSYKEVGQGNTFTLRSVKADNSGRYVCMGKNGVKPHGRGRTRLQIKAAPTTASPTTTPFVPTGPAAPRVYHHEVTGQRTGQVRNEDHELRCTAIGWPRPDIYWRFHGNKLMNSYKYDVRDEPSGRYKITSILKLRSLSQRDYGLYDCHASNYKGRDEIKVELYETFPTK